MYEIKLLRAFVRCYNKGRNDFFRACLEDRQDAVNVRNACTGPLIANAAYLKMMRMDRAGCYGLQLF